MYKKILKLLGKQKLNIVRDKTLKYFNVQINKTQKEEYLFLDSIKYLR